MATVNTPTDLLTIIANLATYIPTTATAAQIAEYKRLTLLGKATVLATTSPAAQAAWDAMLARVDAMERDAVEREAAHG